jgi:hypothetical protein
VSSWNFQSIKKRFNRPSQWTERQNRPKTLNHKFYKNNISSKNQKTSKNGTPKNDKKCQKGGGVEIVNFEGKNVISGGGHIKFFNVQKTRNIPRWFFGYPPPFQLFRYPPLFLDPPSTPQNSSSQKHKNRQNIKKCKISWLQKNSMHQKIDKKLTRWPKNEKFMIIKKCMMVKKSKFRP